MINKDTERDMVTVEDVSTIQASSTPRRLSETDTTTTASEPEKSQETEKAKAATATHEQSKSQESKPSNGGAQSESMFTEEDPFLNPAEIKDFWDKAFAAGWKKVFDAATHSYTLNGVTIPSVTRALDHAGLVSYDMVREDILERKSVLGSLVHQACHFYDEQDLDFNSLSEDVKPRLDAWANFRAETGFVPRRIEKRYVATVNGMTYGLTVDREGFFKKDEAIIDLKTSAAVAPWCGIQLAGYALGVPDFEGKIMSPLTLFYDFSDTHDANVFISALHITIWKLHHGSALRKIEEAA